MYRRIENKSGVEMVGTFILGDTTVEVIGEIHNPILLIFLPNC